MALDFDLLRKKLNTLQGQNNRSTALWKPQAGKSLIRILPWKENPDYPFIELYFHYLAGRTQMSPLTRGKPDPIAEFADKLSSTGSKDDWAMARNFRPKMRTYVPIVVRGEEDKGVRFWGFGQTVYKKLATLMNDEDWGDITHPVHGRDITIEFTPQKDSDTQFAKTEVTVKPKQTPLTTDAEQLKKWLTVQPDVNEVFTLPTYEELSTFLERYLNPDTDKSVTVAEKSPEKSDTDESVDTSGKNTAEAPSQEVSVAEKETDDKKDDVAAEFEKLFNS